MAFGIDFGTTNSAIAYETLNLLGSEGGKPFPSVVAINRTTGEVIAGMEAREQRESLAELRYEVIRSVKRHFDDPNRRWRIAGELWEPKDVARELFRALRAHAHGHQLADRDMDEAVIAIPVGFSPRSRRLLREAAGEAGIRVKTFVSEPTAAYFKIREALPEVRTVAVFDWGGGTLDVSVLEVDNERVDERATRGRNQAGDAIDESIARWAHGRITGGDERGFDHVGAEDRDQLLVYCERAKRGLASQEVELIRLGQYRGVENVELSLDRAQLAEHAGGFVRDAMEVLDAALRDAGLGDNELDCVLAIGGSSNLATVREILENRFGPKLVVPDQDAAWAVAQGASELARDAGRYRPTQRLALVLADEQETPLDLIGADDEFGGRSRQHHIGVVEETRAAQLVFAEPRPWQEEERSAAQWPRIGFMSVPIQGFEMEQLMLSVRLTEDLTFEACVKGDKMIDDDAAHWQYEKVRFAYELPRPR